MQHLDEGTIHAWLDGELSADEAEKIAMHAAECPECGALVAEARGLIAASTRILIALDDVPAGVMPSGSVVSEKPAVVGGPTFRRHWYDRTDLRAAAALLFVAGASLVAVKLGRNPEASLKAVTSAARSPGAVAPLLQDTGAPAAAEIVQQDKALEMRAVAGGTSSSVERKRSESAVAAAPPAASPRVAAQSPAPALGLIRGKDEVIAAKSMDAAVAAARVNATVVTPPSLNKSEPRVQLRESGVSGVARADAPAPGRVEGLVTDKVAGKGISAAKVTVEGTTLGATTDQQGRFAIDSVPAGMQRLMVRHIGYLPQTIPLAVNESAGANANVALAPSMIQLDQVVITSVAATSGAEATPLRVLKADTVGTTRRVVYQVSPGIEVTLIESPIDIAPERKLLGAISAGDHRGAAQTLMSVGATAQPAINTISWRDASRRYTLSGPLKPNELEAIKARLIKMPR